MSSLCPVVICAHVPVRVYVYDPTASSFSSPSRASKSGNTVDT